MVKSLIIQHNQSNDNANPYATLVLEPDQGHSDVVEKELHFGLFVLGTEKHESRRIDNQLRGRSGRQGDPGVSQFYVALDDEIMRKMGGDTIKSIAKKLLPSDELGKLELTQSQFTNAITRAQKQMEGHNFSIRKHLFEYDNVVNKQRMKVYRKRDEILHRGVGDKDQIVHEVALMIHEVVKFIVINWGKAGQSWGELVETINQVFGFDISSVFELAPDSRKTDSIISAIGGSLVQLRDVKLHSVKDDAKLVQIIAILYLDAIDKYWIEHIDTMHHLREKVGLYGYAQQDPLVMYKQEGYKLYEELWTMIKMEFLSHLFKLDFEQIHGFDTTVQFDELVTNEEDFEDNLTGDMSRVGVIDATGSDGTDSQTSGQPHKQQGIELIDLSKAKTKPFVIDRKVGPNEPCPCGSGKKYKKCHGG